MGHNKEYVEAPHGLGTFAGVLLLGIAVLLAGVLFRKEEYFLCYTCIVPVLWGSIRLTAREVVYRT